MNDEEKCDVREPDIPVLNNESFQNWISIKKFIPSRFGTYDIKGDYGGRYWCLVEREYKETDNPFSYGNNHLRRIESTCELCYWNDLADRFQDKDSEWVVVTHWCPVPNLPEHNITEISREDMLAGIESGVYELVEHENQKKHIDIEGMWKITKKLALYSVSLNDEVFLSTEINDGIEDCMWCIKK